MICANSRLSPKDLDLMSMKGLECKVVILQTQKSRLVVVVIYRAPSIGMKTFVERLTCSLDMMPQHVPTIILGDFNDDLAAIAETEPTLIMGRFGFKQFLSKPTTDWGTTIDHVYCNVDDSNIHIDVHDAYYSDHDMVFFTANHF